MAILKKLLLALFAAAGITVLAGVVWFIWLVLTSSSESDGFGQDHQEQWAVASCWRDIRDETISGTEQCSDYARAHLSFFTAELTADPATTTCNLSRSHLDYARKNNPDAKELLAQLTEEMEPDCSHPGVAP